VFLRDLSVNTFLCLLFLGTESGGHASMMTGRATRGAKNFLAGINKTFLNVRLSDGVRGDTWAATAVRGVFIAGVGFG
jgi:hypothetical protein